MNSAHPFAWSPDGRSIVFSQFMLVDNVRTFADLFRIDVASGRVARLTRSARLTSPDMHPAGKLIVAVQYDRDRSRLVTVHVDSTSITPLTEFSADVAWGPARWSPDGTRLAAVRFTRGASHDLVLLSEQGQLLQTLTEDRAIEGVPAWDTRAPAGTRRLFYSSDRTGSRELYAAELDADDNPRLFLTARVVSGFHDLTVIPGSRSNSTAVVATVTHADGRHLERLTINRNSWVEAPVPAAQYLQRSAAIDATPASLEATAPRPYASARDLWPTGWSPVFETIGQLGVFAGAATGGIDVIGRHQWQGSAVFGPDTRTMGAARYVYRRFPRALLFGQASSTWRLEQRGVSSSGELLRVERKRSAAVGVNVPWSSLRRLTVFSANLQMEDRHREYGGDAAAIVGADPIRQDPKLIGGGLGLSFSNTQAGLRSISAQDGVRFSASVNYLKAPADERWRSGWEAAASGYRSFPSWTRAGRPVLAGTVRVAEERGPAASRLTAGGLAATALLEGSSTNFEVRGYPAGFVAAPALWGARVEVRVPIARVSRGLGASPLYVRGLSGAWFVDSVGAASRVDLLGAPQLLSTGAELSSDINLFSFVAVRVRAGVGVPLKTLGSVSRGDARLFMTAGTSF